MIRRVNHVQITIPSGSEDRARNFYRGILGLKEIPKPSSLLSRGGFWLELDGFQIHVGIEDGVRRENTKTHLAYEVKNLDVWRKNLTDGGVEITDGTPIPNFRRFEFRDPFGNRVEFLEQTDNG